MCTRLCFPSSNIFWSNPRSIKLMYESLAPALLQFYILLPFPFFQILFPMDPEKLVSALDCHSFGFRGDSAFI